MPEENLTTWNTLDGDSKSLFRSIIGQDLNIQYYSGLLKAIDEDPAKVVGLMNLKTPDSIPDAKKTLENGYRDLVKLYLPSLSNEELDSIVSNRAGLDLLQIREKGFVKSVYWSMPNNERSATALETMDEKIATKYGRPSDD